MGFGETPHVAFLIQKQKHTDEWRRGVVRFAQKGDGFFGAQVLEVREKAEKYGIFVEYDI